MCKTELGRFSRLTPAKRVVTLYRRRCSGDRPQGGGRRTRFNAPVVGGLTIHAHVRAILDELRPRLELLYGQRLAHLVLFGSHARGDAEPGADVDVLVVLRGSVSPGEEIARAGPITAALSLKHDLVLSCTFVSQERYETEQSPLLINVRREGAPA